MQYFALYNKNHEVLPVYQEHGQLIGGSWLRYDRWDQGLGKHPFPIAVPHLAADSYFFLFHHARCPSAHDAGPGGVGALPARPGADGRRLRHPRALDLGQERV